MSTAYILRRLGLFIEDGFLDGETCRAICEEMNDVPSVAATVGQEADLFVVDKTKRDTRYAEVSDTTEGMVRDLMVGKMAELADYFDEDLSGLQTPQFLIYRPGQFFLPHADRNDEHDAASFSRERRVTIVVWLNACDETGGAESYGGGALRFHGLISDVQGRSTIIPFNGGIGDMVAFTSDTVHEVTPVTTGERLTIVSWFT